MHNQKKFSSKTGVIAGVVVGAAVLGLGLLAGFSVWRHKRRKLSVEQQGTSYDWLRQCSY